LEPWPELAPVKASTVSRRELTQVISRLVGAGKGREAAKLRSYLRAAFSAALRAEGDAPIPPALHGFNLAMNPVSDLATLSQFNRARDTVLSLPELRALWKHLRNLDGVSGSALRLCLLLGGQRPAQLLRIKTTDIDLHAETLTLFDKKGNRVQARAHVLPLTDAIKAELLPWLVSHAGGFLLSSSNGEGPIWPETLSNAFSALAKSMAASGELSQPVRLADIR
jgi:integrase